MMLVKPLVRSSLTLRRARPGHGWRTAASNASVAIAVLGLGWAASGPVTAADQATSTGLPQDLPTVKLGAGMRNIVAMVAATPQQREIGLMFRKSMAAHEGMLFVFEQASPQCFWMRNTLIPLSIAFVADDGTVVNTDEMKPQTLDQHCSSKPVRYVLEMNQGWFTRQGIKPGFRLSGAPFETGR